MHQTCCNSTLPFSRMFITTRFNISGKASAGNWLNSGLTNRASQFINEIIATKPWECTRLEPRVKRKERLMETERDGSAHLTSYEGPDCTSVIP